jgi:hypothetical protein
MNIDEDQQQKIYRMRQEHEDKKYNNRKYNVSILWKIFTFLFVALVIEIILIFYKSPRLWVYRIEVLFANEHTLQKNEIIQMTGLTERVNYNSVSLSDIEANIEKEPRVKSVLVRRGNLGVIVVNITERKPAAIISNTLPPVYIDADGYIFTLPTRPKIDIPLVYGIKATDLNKWLGKIPEDVEGFSVISDCISALNDPTTHSKKIPLKKIFFDKGKIFFELKSKTLALLGVPEQLGIKIWALDQCINEARNSGHNLEEIEHFDVRFPYIAYDNTGKIKYLRGTSYTFRKVDGKIENEY